MIASRFHPVSPALWLAAGALACGLATPVMAAQPPVEENAPVDAMPKPLVDPGDSALFPPLYADTAVDPDITAALEDANEAIYRQIDAAEADVLLATLGRLGLGGKKLPQITHKADASPFRTRAPRALPGDAPQMTWNSLLNPSFGFGDPNWLAVGVSEKVNNFSTMSTDVRMRHASGPLDVQVNVSGRQGLNMAQPMRVAYDSIAMVSLNDNLKVGMVARGDLGNLGNLTPQRNQVAGPVARLKLFGNGTNLSAETGYTFRLRQDGDASLNRLYANLNLNVKL